MKLMPSVFPLLHRLPWRGGLTPQAGQRLTLRVYLGFAILFTVWTPVFLALIATGGLMHNMPLVMASQIVALIGGTGMTIWMLVMMLKISMLRYQQLGLKPSAAVALILGLFLLAALSSVAAYVSTQPMLLLTGVVPFSLFAILPFFGLLEIPSALGSYWEYFETEPLGQSKARQLDPLPTPPGRVENVALFLLQTWIWFGILSLPLHIIFNY